jgi:L-lactate dehydrogenase complex protein LldG
VSAREQILARLRAAEISGYVPVVPVAQAFRPAHEADLRSCAAEELLARFLTELTALGVEHYVEATADAVRARVATIVGDRPVFRWDADELPYGVADSLPASATGTSDRDAQAAAAIGITGCDAAIAETGSLALITGRGKPRAVSLLPPTHLALVRADQLRPTMAGFFRERTGALAAAANCTFITGPSRTADIELTLTVGVHGPGRVIVVVGP